MWFELKESMGNKVSDLLNINNIEDYVLIFLNTETYTHENYYCKDIVKIYYYNEEGYLIIFFENGDVKLHNYDDMTMISLKKDM